MRDAGAHPRVGAEERLHAVAVAREHDDEVLALGLHDLEQDLDRLLAVVALVLRAVEVVRLVDEEHAAVGALEHLAGLRRGVPDVLPDEVVARDRDDLRLLDVAEAMEDLRHPQRDGGLAGAGVAGEAHVQRGARGDQPGLAAEPVDHEQRRDLADPRLDGRERDEVVVELGEHLLDPLVGLDAGASSCAGLIARLRSWWTGRWPCSGGRPAPRSRRRASCSGSGGRPSPCGRAGSRARPRAGRR